MIQGDGYREDSTSELQYCSGCERLLRDGESDPCDRCADMDGGPEEFLVNWRTLGQSDLGGEDH